MERLRTAVAALPPTDGRLHLAELALYEAIEAHASGADWLTGLRRRRGELGPLDLPLAVRVTPLLNRLVLPVGVPIALVGIVGLLFDVFAGPLL